jgi:hypothetical protein
VKLRTLFVGAVLLCIVGLLALGCLTKASPAALPGPAKAVISAPIAAPPAPIAVASASAADKASDSWTAQNARLAAAEKALNDYQGKTDAALVALGGQAEIAVAANKGLIEENAQLGAQVRELERKPDRYGEGILTGLIVETVLMLFVCVVILTKVKPATIAADAGKIATEFQVIEGEAVTDGKAVEAFLAAELNKIRGKSAAAATPANPPANK